MIVCLSLSSHHWCAKSYKTAPFTVMYTCSFHLATVSSSTLKLQCLIIAFSWICLPPCTNPELFHLMYWVVPPFVGWGNSLPAWYTLCRFCTNFSVLFTARQAWWKDSKTYCQVILVLSCAAFLVSPKWLDSITEQQCFLFTWLFKMQYHSAAH